jgi:hypothetical protein
LTTTTNDREKRVPGKWEGTQLQAVLFLRKALPPIDIFTALVGVAPDSQEDRPKEGLRIQSGKVDDTLLQVIVNPIRVDIFRTPSAAGGTMFGVPTLGEFRMELDKFAQLVIKWLPLCNFPTIRLAVVTQAIAPASSSTEAYAILKENLTSVQVQPGTMRDMFFRVNWRAPTSNMPEGYLNRLTTWSAGVLTTRTQGSDLLVIEKHFAHREIDVNTPVDHAGELSRDALVPIFDELFRVVAHTGEVGEGP